MEPSNENEVACEPLVPPDKVGTGSRTPPPTSSAELGRSGSGLCDNKASEIEKYILDYNWSWNIITMKGDMSFLEICWKKYIISLTDEAY